MNRYRDSMTLDTDRWSPPVAIAHRGSRQLWPENTMLAFANVVELGFRHLETDIRITKDGVVVCFHDSTVDRTTEGTGPVSSYTFDELQGLDAGHRHATKTGFDFRGSDVKVPSLEEVLSTFPDISMVVDIKEEGVIDAFASLIDRLGVQERLIVGSFSDERISIFRSRTDGTVPTSSGAALSRMWLLASRVKRGAGGEASALQIPPFIRGVRVVDERLLTAAHAAGLQVHVWTVNDPVEMERLLDLGVDGLVTDRPDRLRELLEERGEWSR